jgi:hypothetical protein
MRKKIHREPRVARMVREPVDLPAHSSLTLRGSEYLGVPHLGFVPPNKFGNSHTHMW